MKSDTIMACSSFKILMEPSVCVLHRISTCHGGVDSLRNSLWGMSRIHATYDCLAQVGNRFPIFNIASIEVYSFMV